jgi:predicted nucleic acid-binding protein
MKRLLVTDASVVVDLLARFDPEPLEAALFDDHAVLLAPELLDIEVLHTLRRLDASARLPAGRRAGLLDEFRALPIKRFRHAVLWDDIWQLRGNLTAYDGCYVALARHVGGTLLTRDARLAAAPGPGVDVQVV